jgi:hypothetical protein
VKRNVTSPRSTASPDPAAIVCATVLNVPFLKGGLGVAIQETAEIGMVEAPETSGPS